MNQTIVNAIKQKRMLDFFYHGHYRVAEPHIYGIKDGVEQILIWQTAGGSTTGGIPNWRRVNVGEISQLTVLDQKFSGRRPYPSGQHSKWDQTYAIVD